MRGLLPILLAVGCAAPPPPPRTPVELPEPDPALREVTRDAVHGAERRGFELERVGEPHFAVEARAQVEAVVVPAGSCRLFVLVGASGVVQASAALYLPDGRRVGRDLGRDGAPPEVGACAGDAPLALFWHSSVRGAGLVRGLEFSIARTADAAAGLVDPSAAVGELALALRRRGFVSRGEPREVSLRAGEPARFPVVLAPQRCLTLVLRRVAGEIRLTEGDEVVVRDGSGGEQAVQLCAEGQERRLSAIIVSEQGGDAEVRLYDADRRSLGGDAALWLGERAPAVTETVEVPESRRLDLGPAEVIEVALPASERCTPVRVRAGEGSAGVWLGDPSETKRSVERCVEGSRARIGSVGGGQVWVGVGTPEATPRPPAQRGAHR